MDDLNVDSFLEHYGVKGMKWGVRKSNRSTKKKAREDAKVTKIQEKRGIKRSSAQAVRRQQKKAQKELATKAAAGVTSLVLANYVRDFAATAVGKATGIPFSVKDQSPTTRIVNKGLKVSMKTARAASKGARMVWDAKGTGKVTYMPPGTYIPGSSSSASVTRGALTVGRKALGR